MVLTEPYISGAFTWSGFDYKGEPVPNTWPDVNSHFGFLDIAGFLKDRGYWHRIWLANPDPPEVHLFPHWNWEDADVLPPNVTVFAMANVIVGKVDLTLNGQSFGSKTIESVGGWASWVVPYTPGKLT